MDHKENYVYLDILRTIAALLVIFNHLPGYTLYMVAGGIKQWFYLIVTMITRINTPLFMMISGALLLGRTESYKTIIIKRIFRYMLVIVIANTMIWLLYKPINFKLLFQGIIKGNIQGSYWYLYSYLGFLCSLPFLRMIAPKLKKNDFYYLFVIHFIFCALVPCANVALSKYDFAIDTSASFNIAIMMERSIFYPLVGFYLHSIDLRYVKRRDYTFVSLLSGIGIILECVFTLEEGKTGNYTQHYVMLFDWCIAITVFLLVRKIVSLQSNVCRASNFWRKCASVTFGVYLFDPVLKKLMYSAVENILEPLLPTIIVSACWCIISFVLCGIFTAAIKRIRPIGKLL